MGKKIIILLITLISVAAFTGVTYSLYISKSTEGPVEVYTAQIKTEYDFIVNGNSGIPGEILSLSEISEGTAKNIIKKGSGSADYIFKLTYEVLYENALDYISDIRLSAAKIDELKLIKENNYDTQSRKIVYYGIHEGEEDLQLGELLIEFAILKKSEMEKPFKINTSIEACQITEDAVRDVFGIDSDTEGGKYAVLFK